MTSNEEKTAFEQACTQAGEVLTTLWAETYVSLRLRFNEQEAWELLKLVVSAQSGSLTARIPQNK